MDTSPVPSQKKGVGVLGWLGIGCGGLIVLGLIGAAVFYFMYGKQFAQDLAKDPTKPSWVNSVDALPPEPRWWGYSVGKWVDDYTFVVRTNGFQDDRTWLDNAGFPQSDTTEVEETYHRLDDKHLELTVHDWVLAR